MNIKCAGEIYDSLVNGPEMRYVLFTQGCIHHCEGCQNKHTWSIDNGINISINKIIKHIKKSPFIKGITISGGEPFLQAESIYYLIKKIKDDSELSKLNIMIYTGYTLKELKNMKNYYINNILESIDYLVDGKFEKDKPTDKLYIGSSNQKIYDLKNNKEIEF